MPGGVGAEAENEISGVRRIDVDAQVLSRRLALIRGGVEGCFATVLVRRPFQVCALGALAENGGGGRGEAGFGKSHGEERIVGIGRGVFVCTFKALTGVVDIQHAPDGVVLIAWLEEVESGGECGGEKNGGAGSEEDGAQPRPRSPDCGSEEDSHRRLEHNQPAPRELQESELGQRVPDGQGDGKLEKQDSDRDERKRKQPSQFAGQSAAGPTEEKPGEGHCNHGDGDGGDFE